MSERFEILEQAADKVGPAVAERLGQLTLGDKGMMRATFNACQRNDSFHGRCFIALDADGHILGWVLRWKLRNLARWSLHIFTDPAARRRGVGTQLIHAALDQAAKTRIKRRLVAHPTSVDADAFYAAFAADPRIEIRRHRPTSGDTPTMPKHPAIDVLIVQANGTVQATNLAPTGATVRRLVGGDFQKFQVSADGCVGYICDTLPADTGPINDVAVTLIRHRYHGVPTTGMRGPMLVMGPIHPAGHHFDVTRIARAVVTEQTTEPVVELSAA